mmetsp:Transcript_23638/g.41733  ORF Transcript_23638/g.41733 Transcript_23638/m.41733 type:complete len:421 (-) Transcript_23638:828-2090(-)
MGDLGRYLASGRGALVGASRASRIALSIGNDAGDLDSIVSALALAFCWDKLPGTAEQGTGVAVAPFKRKEFRLRGDARWLFKKAGVAMDAVGAPEGLLFMDDLDQPTVEELDQRCSLLLTDHNEPGTKLCALWGGRQNLPPVASVVDHHQDAGQFTDALLRVVDPACGSACTLVASQALSNQVTLPEDLVTLLLGTILLDTRDFDADKKRFAEIDVQTHKLLCETYPNACPSREEQTKWYKELKDARHDVDGLSSADLVLLDLKSSTLSSGPFSGSLVAFASIMDSMTGFVERAGGPEKLQEELKQVAEEQGYFAIICMTKAEKLVKGAPKRKHILVHSTSTPFEDHVMKSVVNVPEVLSPELRENELFRRQGVLSKGFEVEPSNLGGDTALRIVSIQDDITRKTMMPTVLEIAQKSATL